jgi:predicted GNAT family N-acyltransferase
VIALRWIDREADAALYAGERRLRYEVLRAPLGMPEGSEENPQEARCQHCVAFEPDTGRVVGCVLALPDRDDPTRVKLLQMAVAKDLAHRGIGARLVRELERRVRDAGAVEVHMHARMSARGFYEKLGYSEEGEVFSEVGLPHVRMHRRLDG